MQNFITKNESSIIYRVSTVIFYGHHHPFFLGPISDSLLRLQQPGFPLRCTFSSWLLQKAWNIYIQIKFLFINCSKMIKRCFKTKKNKKFCTYCFQYDHLITFDQFEVSWPSKCIFVFLPSDIHIWHYSVRHTSTNNTYQNQCYVN